MTNQRWRWCWLVHLIQGLRRSASFHFSHHHLHPTVLPGITKKSKPNSLHSLASSNSTMASLLAKLFEKLSLRRGQDTPSTAPPDHTNNQGSRGASSTRSNSPASTSSYASAAVGRASTELSEGHADDLTQSVLLPNKGQVKVSAGPGTFNLPSRDQQDIAMASTKNGVERRSASPSSRKEKTEQPQAPVAASGEKEAQAVTGTSDTANRDAEADT